MSTPTNYRYSEVPTHPPHGSGNPQARTGYFLPEHCQYQLAGLREHLQFLARAIASRNADDEHDVWLQCSPDQLAWCFRLLAGQITPVLAEMEGPGPIILETVDETPEDAE